MNNNMISNNAKVKKQVKLLKSLAHPYRLRIIRTLRDGEHRVCYIESHLGLEQPYCSQQLAILQKAGLVRSRRDGKNIFYKVVDSRVFVVVDIIDDLAKL